MSNLDKLLTEFKDARSAASFGEWIEQQRSLANHRDPYIFDRTTGALFQPIGGRYALDSIDFVCLAANNSAKLIKIIEVMKEALIHSENGCLVPPDGGSPDVDDHIKNAKQALQQAEQIAGE